MQLIAALILCAILLIVLGAAFYFAKHQKSHTNPYSSGARALGPQFGGTAMDVRENLEKEIAAGQHEASAGHQAVKRKRSKKR